MTLAFTTHDTPNPVRLLRHAWPGFAILATVLALALWHQLATRNWALTDSPEYLQAAHYLFHPVPDQYPALEVASKRMLAYPLLIAVCGHYIPLVLAVQCVLMLLNAALLVLCLYRFVPPRLLRWVPALLIVFPQNYFYAGMVMSEVLLQTALLVALVGPLYFSRGQRGYWTWQAAGWALAVITKPALLYLVLLLCGAALFYIFTSKRALPRLALWATLLPLGAIGVQFTRNYALTGYVHYSSIKEVNLLYYNAYYLVQREEPHHADSLARHWRTTAEAQPTFAARQLYMQDQAMQVIGRYPGSYGFMHLFGIAHFLLDPGRFDLYNFYRLEPPGGDNGFLYHYSRAGYAGVIEYLREQPVWPLLILAMNLLINIGVLVLVGRFLTIPYSLWHQGALLVPVFYLAFITGPLGAARFRMPVSPHLLAMAVIAVAGHKPRLPMRFMRAGKVE